MCRPLTSALSLRTPRLSASPRPTSPSSSRSTSAFAFSGLSSELDWALLEREKAPFGLTFVFTPQWRLDDTSGAPQESFGFPIQLLADVALSPDKWFAAANLNYAPVFIHNPGRWTTSQPMEISAATSFGISSDIFIGGEIRHLTQDQHGFFSELTSSITNAISCGYSSLRDSSARALTILIRALYDWKPQALLTVRGTGPYGYTRAEDSTFRITRARPLFERLET